MIEEHKTMKSSNCYVKTKYVLALVAALALTSSKVPTTTAFHQSSLSSLTRQQQQQSIRLLNQHRLDLNHNHCHLNTFNRSSTRQSKSNCKLNAMPTTHQSALFRTTKARNWNSNSSTERSRKWTLGKRRSSGRTQSGGVSLQSSTMPHADIAVRLDQPILSPTQSSHFQKNASTMLKSILTIFLSDIAKTALIAFFLAFTVTFLTKSSTISKTISPLFSSIKHVFKLCAGQIQKVKEGVIASSDKENGIPMTFDNDEDGNVGWGVCTLSSKKKIGRSQFMQYEFKLPNEENILNLALGQKVTLCCLDDEDRVAKKDYYLFSPKSKKGSFSILAPGLDGTENDNDVKLAKGEGDFRKVLANELEMGDEVALQPGPRTLSYKGEYLPVTDMVYIASGSGIAPVLDQVKAVLPSGSSSVKSVTVIWLNGKEEDFDVALSSLEDEYFKYSTKLAVSCVVDEKNGRKIAQNREVDEALPPFEPGTMAVIAGPKRFGNDARSMLMGYGYPDECICVLP